jgi:YD repeat-containing protein
MQLAPLERPERTFFWTAPATDTGELTRSTRAQAYAMVLYGLALAERAADHFGYPNTDETADPENITAWRYAYNDAGDLVGTSDARGCGVNFAYDGAGRLTSEDYSPCLDTHAPYSEPNITQRTGLEVFYHYDTLPSDAPANFCDSTAAESFRKGRLVAVYDRASFTLSCFVTRPREASGSRREQLAGLAEESQHAELLKSGTLERVRSAGGPRRDGRVRPFTERVRCAPRA